MREMRTAHGNFMRIELAEAIPTSPHEIHQRISALHRSMVEWISRAAPEDVERLRRAQSAAFARGETIATLATVDELLKSAARLQQPASAGARAR